MTTFLNKLLFCQEDYFKQSQLVKKLTLSLSLSIGINQIGGPTRFLWPLDLVGKRSLFMGGG